MKAYARKTEAVWDDVLIPILKDRLISLIRQWCQVWLKDPDLVIEDQHTLPDEWEQKIDLLKIKMNKLFQKIANPGGDETRLDDYAKKFVQWLHENSKSLKPCGKSHKFG